MAVTYSVLHHVPDYLRAVNELVRVLKPGGLLYIDHEFTDNHWRPDGVLGEYQALTSYRILDHLAQLMRDGDLFSLSLYKTALIKLFVNRRYKRVQTPSVNAGCPGRSCPLAITGNIITRGLARCAGSNCWRLGYWNPFCLPMGLPDRVIL